jgi:Uma2 family endonuclease
MSVVMTDWITRHRVTVDEYYRMAEAGILSSDARVELIEGEIIDMSPIGTGHGGTVTHLNRLLHEAVGRQAQVLVQSCIRLSDISEPVPDLALVVARADFYKKRHPGPSDTLLVVEVSQSSLRYDLQIKAPLYARHGIPEYWLIDLPAREIRFFRSPKSGQYSDIFSTDAPTMVTLTQLPNVRVDLTHLLDEQP